MELDNGGLDEVNFHVWLWRNKRCRFGLMKLTLCLLSKKIKENARKYGNKGYK